MLWCFGFADTLRNYNKTKFNHISNLNLFSILWNFNPELLGIEIFKNSLKSEYFRRGLSLLVSFFADMVRAPGEQRECLSLAPQVLGTSSVTPDG